MHYYTYAYLREDRTPYYVGKGTGNRIYSTNRTIKPPKDKSRIIYLKQNLTEEEAFKHEKYMIAVLGRKNLGTGILYNMTDGGDGSSGCIPSEETRKKIGDAQKGRTHSEETKRKMSEARKGNTYMLGKTLSEEHRKKLIEARKGKTHSEESKIKMSDAQKGKTLSKETRKKQSDAMIGRKWWNDGCGNHKRMIECPGDGWKPGRK
jgi:hypothetical protein